jgi:hypothetical protein
MLPVDPETKKALDAIDRVCETPTPTGPVELDAEYLRNIARVEAAPSNRAGTDKSWVERSWIEWREMYRNAR